MGVKTTNNSSKKLKIIIQRMKKLKPILRVIAEDMRNDVRSNFDNQRSFMGIKWKKSKRAIKDGGKTLMDTGRLYNSFAVKATNNYARVGTNVKYARVMNEGVGKGQLWKGEVNVKSHYRRIKRRKKNGEWAKNKKRIKVRGFTRKTIAPWGDIPAYHYMGVNYRMEKNARKKMSHYILFGRL